MNLALLSRLVLHLSVCVIYPFTSYFGFWVYQKLAGAPIARGVDIGIAMQLIFYSFIIINLIMVGVRSFIWKICFLGLALLSVCIYLLPDFPLRALGIVVMFGGLTLLAICLSNWVGLRLSVSATNKNS